MYYWIVYVTYFTGSLAQIIDLCKNVPFIKQMFITPKYLLHVLLNLNSPNLFLW